MSKNFNKRAGMQFITAKDLIFAYGDVAGVTAYLNLFLYNKECDKVFRIREYGKSKGKVPAVAGIPVMDAKKVQPLCEDATEVLFAELEDKLGKIVKKSAKKL